MRQTQETRSKVLEFLQDFIEERSYPPTVRDIKRGCGISSTSVVQHHLKVLERDGLIRREREISRGIRAAGCMAGTVEVPVLGTIAAGVPIPVPTEETWETPALDRIEVPRELTQGKERVYALRVKGCSMLEALVDDGDMLIMEPVATVEDGQMVAAWLSKESETTLKKFYLENGKVRLQPANSQMGPIYVDPRDVEIQGRVIGVIRKLR